MKKICVVLIVILLSGCGGSLSLSPMIPSYDNASQMTFTKDRYACHSETRSPTTCPSSAHMVQKLD